MQPIFTPSNGPTLQSCSVMPISQCRRNTRGGTNLPPHGATPRISSASRRTADSKIALLTILISSSRRSQTPSPARAAPLEAGRAGPSRMSSSEMPRKNQRPIDMTSPQSISRPGGNPKARASDWGGKITKEPSSTIAPMSTQSSKHKETLRPSMKVHTSL